MPKCVKINLKETLVFINMQKNPTSSVTFFLRYWKLAILENLRMLDHPHQKSEYQFVDNFHAYLHSKKQLHLSLSFLRYCKEIKNLLFWIIWTCLVTHTQNKSINLKKPMIFIGRQKINFIVHFLLEILQRYCELVILGTFGMYGYAHLKW